MNIKFEAPRGQRILRNHFFGITCFPRSESDRWVPFLWWDEANRQWTNDAVPGSSSHAHCKSYKAFLKHIKKHKNSFKGFDVVLCSHYVGYDIIAEFE